MLLKQVVVRRTMEYTVRTKDERSCALWSEYLTVHVGLPDIFVWALVTLIPKPLIPMQLVTRERNSSSFIRTTFFSFDKPPSIQPRSHHNAPKRVNSKPSSPRGLVHHRRGCPPQRKSILGRCRAGRRSSRPGRKGKHPLAQGSSKQKRPQPTLQEHVLHGGRLQMVSPQPPAGRRPWHHLARGCRGEPSCECLTGMSGDNGA